MSDIVEDLKCIENIWSTNVLYKFIQQTWEKEEFEKIIQSSLFKTIFPEKEIDRKFRKLLKPFIFEKGEKKIYCKYNGIRFDGEEPTYIFSALTKEMVDVDAAFFNENSNVYSALDLIYKPYTYELSFDEELTPEFFKDKEEDTWYEVKVKKYKEKEKDKIYGKISYGASPLDFQEIEIEWGKEVASTIVKGFYTPTQRQIDSYYISQPAGTVDGWLDWLFENNTHRFLSVCRVGQANAVLGINENSNEKRQFAFDIGLPNDDFIKLDATGGIDRKSTGLYDEDVLANFKPRVIFISHWHADHYKGAFIMPRDTYIGNCTAMWIVPSYKLSNKQYNANRLVGYLMKTGHIAFMEDGFSYDKNGVSLYRVKKGDPKDLNNDCILLQLNKTLLPGDCHYDNWPADYGKVKNGSSVSINKMENVTVSHHASGGSVTNLSEPKLKPLFNISEAIAYVCVGNNKWKHPNSNVLNMFKDTAHLGFQDVIRTDDDTRKKTDYLIIDL